MLESEAELVHDAFVYFDDHSVGITREADVVFDIYLDKKFNKNVKIPLSPDQVVAL